MSFHLLVLAGGSGTRLWPLSRVARPKHLLPLGPGGMSLLRATVDRVAPLGASIHVVTAADQVDGCLEALHGSEAEVSVIVEPSARGTGPAMGLAVHEVAATDPDAVMVAVHADHHVPDADAYRAAILASAGWATATGGLATVGLSPTSPATGFGYIEVGEALAPDAWTVPPGMAADALLLSAAAALPAARARGFVEKPDAVRAAEFVNGGRHLWNLGLFAWTVPPFLAELDRADPSLNRALAKVVEERRRGAEAAAAQRYSALAAIAVEPLVFERTSQLAVVQASFAWSDLGTWGDLAAAAVADSAGNVAEGEGEAHFIDAHGSYAWASAGRTVVVLGAEGLVVVDTGDAVLVMPARATQQVKDVVARLRAAGRTDLV